MAQAKIFSRLKKQVDYQRIISEGKPFTDPDFKANASSMGSFEGNYVWKRASEIFGNHEKVFDTFAVDDIEQGDLGDCYFLSAIAALAEVPSRVEACFPVKEKNSAGCYAVTFNVSGQPVTVVVDDFFPVTGGGKPAFAGSKGKELWVMLLEKAWAKIHGNFGVTEGGDSRESLNALTGAPSDYIKHSSIDSEQFWKDLKQYDKLNYIMNTGASADQRGVIKGHAYTLINVFELNNNGRSLRLVQIRNPWGCTEWEGAWGDKDSRWTPELNQQTNHTNKDDGTFFMEFDDFKSVFAHTFVAKYHLGYTYNYKVVEKQKAFVAFECPRTLTGYASSYQISARLGRSVLGSYKCERQVLTLYQIVDGKPVEKSKKMNDAVGIATIDITLEPGTYLMKAEFNTPPTFPYTSFVIYGDKATDLVEIPITDEKEINEEILKKAFGNVKKSYNINKPPAKHNDFRSCIQGHPLVWSTVAGKTGENFKCENCRTIHKASEGRWKCSECSFDVCSKCRPKEVVKAEGTKENPKAKCSNNHEMKFEGGNEDELFNCDKCGKAFMGNVPRWRCNTCGYDICHLCLPGPNWFKMPNYKEIDFCFRNHPLVFTNSNTLNNKFQCDICDKIGVSNAGRWVCKPCGLNICCVCKPHKGSTAIVSPATGLIQCKNGHLLEFTCATQPDVYYICDKCDKTVDDPDQWRWTCPKCEFDVCIHCCPEPTGRRDLLCNNKHKLAYSTSPGANLTFSRCRKCYKAIRLTSGRYTCAVCDYDICPECQPKNEPVREFGQKKALRRLGYFPSDEIDKTSEDYNKYGKMFDLQFGDKKELLMMADASKRLDNKFKILHDFTQDVEASGCDLLLFKNKLNRDLADILNELREAWNAIQILMADRMKLRDLFIAYQLRMEKIKVQIEKLVGLINERNAVIEKLNSQMTENKKEIEELHTEVEDLKRQLNEKVAELMQLQKELADLKKLHDKLARLIDEFKATNEKLNKELDVLKKKMLEKEKDLRDLLQKLAQAKALNKELMGILEKLRGEYAKLKKDYDRLRKDYDKLIVEVNALQKNKEFLAAELNRIKTTYNELVAKYAALQKTNNDLTEENKRLKHILDDLQLKLEELEAENKKLKAELQFLKDAYESELARLKDENARLREENKMLRESNKNLRDLNDELLREIERLKREIEALKRQLEALMIERRNEIEDRKRRKENKSRYIDILRDSLKKPTEIEQDEPVKMYGKKKSVTPIKKPKVKAFVEFYKKPTAFYQHYIAYPCPYCMPSYYNCPMHGGHFNIPGPLNEVEIEQVKKMLISKDEIEKAKALQTLLFHAQHDESSKKLIHEYYPGINLEDLMKGKDYTAFSQHFAPLYTGPKVGAPPPTTTHTH